MLEQLHLLKTKRFLPLFVTQALGAFNDNALKGGIIVLITFGAKDHNGKMLVPLASSMLIIPMILFSPISGELADKFNKAKITKLLKLGEIIIMLLAGLGFYYQNILFLMFVLFLTGLQSTLFGPIKYGALPELLKIEELVEANALVELTTFFAILLGMLLGSILPSLNDGYIELTLIMVVLAVIGFLSSLKMPDIHGDPNIKLKTNLFRGIYTCIHDASIDRYNISFILAISWFWMLGAALTAILPSFTKMYLGADEIVYSLLLFIFATGIGIGSLLCNKVLQGKIHIKHVPLSALIVSIFLADLYFGNHSLASSNLIGAKEFFVDIKNYRLIADIFFISCAGGMYIVPLYAMVQDRAPKSHKARIIAANNLLNALLITCAMVGLPFLFLFNISIPQVFLILALLNLGVYANLKKLLITDISK